jgi:hypothetical protein
MKLTRLSLYYLAGYLLPSGLGLLLMPELVFKLLFSNANGAYGDVMPRMAGAAFTVLGILVVQTIRQRLESLYLTFLGARALLVAIWLWLFARTSDPFFIAVAAVVLLGMALTATGYLLDAKSGRPATARP